MAQLTGVYWQSPYSITIIGRAFRTGLLAQAMFATLTILGIAAPGAYANVIFSENFNSPGSPINFVNYRGDPLYTKAVPGGTGGDATGNATENAFILMNFEGLIPIDQSGQSGQTPGFFLYHQTVSTGAPSYQGIVWQNFVASSITVTPGSQYEFSFYLTNRSVSGSLAQIRPLINNLPIASAVSANSTIGLWQQFSFSWTANSSFADIALENLQVSGAGNDFGIDSISFSAVPEPSSFALCVLGVAVTGTRLLRRRIKKQPA